MPVIVGQVGQSTVNVLLFIRAILEKKISDAHRQSDTLRVRNLPK